MGKNQPVPEPVGPPPTELEQIRMTTNHVQNEVSRQPHLTIKPYFLLLVLKTRSNTTTPSTQNTVNK